MSTSRYPIYGSESGSLISEITGYFTPEVLRSAGLMLGEPDSSIYQALHVAAPTVLSGMAHMASTSEGANNLANMIREGGYAGLTENPTSLFRGGTASKYLLSAGERHLGGIFGGNTTSVTELVAQSGAVSASSATKLMALLTPLTFGVLGKRIPAEPSGSSGLADMLSRQRNEIETAAPPGLSRILGLGPRMVPPVRKVEQEPVLDAPTHIERFADPTPAERPSVETTAIGPEPTVTTTPIPERAGAVAERPSPVLTRPRAGGGLRWLPLLLVLLAAIALLGYLLRRARAPRTNLRPQGLSVANTLANLTLPNGVNLTVPQNSINYNLATFLGDGSTTNVPRSFVFEHLNFANGSTRLTEGSDKTLADLAQILNAYPNSHVLVTGHTDNSGSPQSNQTLSLDRANAIKAMLVNNGIAANRISTRGLGQEQPVAPNDSEQGRAQNRRTELTVTQK